AGQRALPAERLHDEVAVDAPDAGGVDLSVRARPQDAEVDPLRRQAHLAAGAGAGRVAHEVGALPLQVGRHLARESLHDAEPDERRRVAGVASPDAVAVAVEERVVGLRSGAARPADPVARRARRRLRAAEEAVVDAAERPAAGRLRSAAAEAVRVAVLVLEEELA